MGDEAPSPPEEGTPMQPRPTWWGAGAGTAVSPPLPDLLMVMPNLRVPAAAFCGVTSTLRGPLETPPGLLGGTGGALGVREGGGGLAGGEDALAVTWKVTLPPWVVVMTCRWRQR